mmetsp:Transcript_10115/g.26231  ORF Transcript_10115/g.26231 Transcript_10115/m.26231 type:complete len:310 (+) Transcript_10115:417-1346(+)
MERTRDAQLVANIRAGAVDAQHVGAHHRTGHLEAIVALSGASHTRRSGAIGAAQHGRWGLVLGRALQSGDDMTAEVLVRDHLDDLRVWIALAQVLPLRHERARRGCARSREARRRLGAPREHQLPHAERGGTCIGGGHGGSQTLESPDHVCDTRLRLCLHNVDRRRLEIRAEEEQRSLKRTSTRRRLSIHGEGVLRGVSVYDTREVAPGEGFAVNRLYDVTNHQLRLAALPEHAVVRIHFETKTATCAAADGHVSGAGPLHDQKRGADDWSADPHGADGRWRRERPHRAPTAEHDRCKEPRRRGRQRHH